MFQNTLSHEAIEEQARTPSLLPEPTASRRETHEASAERPATIAELVPYYLAYAKYELRYAAQTLESCHAHMRRIARSIGNIPPEGLTQGHVMRLKAEAASRGVGAHHTRGMIVTLRSFLRFCQLAAGIATLNPETIKAPRIPRREVVYLTKDEVRQFLSAIPLHGKSGRIKLTWLCCRALAEVLLGTALRISETLSLRRSSINFQTGEAMIIGKGNRERIVFFSPRALAWVKEYLSKRKDSHEALFVLAKKKPVSREAAQDWFRKVRVWSGIKKKVTPHMLRHTAATTLLFNGCPINHIKEILGHTNLETTCRFYLGTDKRAAKEAHRRYMDYDGFKENKEPRDSRVQ